MFVENLLYEVQTLSNRFAPIEAQKLAAHGDAEPVSWHSARGLLDIVIACGKISDISTKISKAGYWECDRDLLAHIGAQSRQILYNISDMKLSDAPAQP
jgi:hypothetical protein